MAKTRSNEEWLHDLTAEGPVQELAITDLREILLRAALYFFSRNPSDFRGLRGDEVRRQAEDCAQDALIAVMKHLQDFRGDSKFTTWAYKFAINIALMAARRERWKAVSLDELASPDEAFLSESLLRDRSDSTLPESAALQQEIRRTIQEVLDHELTQKQRRVVSWMIFNDVPMDEVVRHLGTNRNAVYKLLHDARRKIKSRLQARGFDIGETLRLFDPSG